MPAYEACGNASANSWWHFQTTFSVVNWFAGMMYVNEVNYDKRELFL
jgi:hypothetical protein